MMIRIRHQKVENQRAVKIKLFAIVGAMLVFAAFLVSCDNSVLEGMADDSSFEAKLEAARIALDKGEYARAVELLEALYSENPGNAVIQQYLSSAYAGLAGLDTFNLLTTIEALDDNNNSGSIDMMGLILGDSTGTLTSAQLQEKLANIVSAMDALEGISDRNDDQNIQLGLLAVAHVSLTMGNIVLEDQGDASVTLTEEALGAQYTDSQPADFSDVSTETQNTSGLTEDLAYIADAVSTLDAISDAQNDLSEDFSQFRNDIDSNSDGSVSESDLENYFNNQI